MSEGQPSEQLLDTRRVAALVRMREHKAKISAFVGVLTGGLAVESVNLFEQHHSTAGKVLGALAVGAGSSIVYNLWGSRSREMPLIVDQTDCLTTEEAEFVLYTPDRSYSS